MIRPVIFVAFDEGERLLFESCGTSRGYRSGCHAISRFGRHLLTGWNIFLDLMCSVFLARELVYIL